MKKAKSRGSDRLTLISQKRIISVFYDTILAMKSRLFFYFSSLALMCSTLLIYSTQDGGLWPFWLVTCMLFFVSLPFYVISVNVKRDNYAVNRPDTLTKAYKDRTKKGGGWRMPF